jgi:hypothetical protein
MPTFGLVRSLYSRASAVRALRRPLDAIRAHPRVRAYARRHVGVLLARGTTWANLDGALRLIAESPRRQVVFGPWRGNADLELLYWAPFVRWAQQRFSLDPARVAVVSRGGAGNWYGDAAGTYADADEVTDAMFPGATVFRPDPFLALVEEYRRGAAAPRPLLKRSRHGLLARPDDPAGRGVPQAYVAVALAPTAAFPDSEANHELAAALTGALAVSGPVVPLDPGDGLRAQQLLLRHATGVVAAYSGLALLAAFSGIPVLALRSADGDVAEPDLDLAQRITIALGGSLTILDAGDLDALSGALGGSVP